MPRKSPLFDIAVIKAASAKQLQQLRWAGLSEAYYYQVKFENKSRLCWVEYPDGTRRINIWPTSAIRKPKPLDAAKATQDRISKEIEVRTNMAKQRIARLAMQKFAKLRKEQP